MICNRRAISRFAAVALILILRAIPSLAADAKPAPRLDRDFEIQVVDSVSKEPISGAGVSISMSGAQSKNDRTEDKGRVWVMLPEKEPSYLNIRVKMEGYISRNLEYRDGAAIPETDTFEFQCGTSIGGVIQDELGKPIAGVEISCMVPGDGSAGPRDKVRIWEDVKGRSDDQGQWRCDGIHSDLKELSIKVTHPDFVSDKSYDGKLINYVTKIEALKREVEKAIGRAAP